MNTETSAIGRTPDISENDMSTTRSETNPLKMRRFWWMESGFFWFIGVFYVGFSLLVMFVLYLTIHRAILGLELLAGFWLIILPIVIWLYKRTLSENYSVNQSVVDRTKRNLVLHRRNTFREFLRTEINLLERGQKIPVLDIWKLDQRLAGRHPFFRRTSAILIDPIRRELHIRLQLEMHTGQGGCPGINDSFLRDLLSFIQTIAQDGYLKALSKYFAIVVIEVYALGPDEYGVYSYRPVLSVLMKTEMFWMVSDFVKLGSVFGLGEVRFEKGNVIKPHRSIEGPRLGTK